MNYNFLTKIDREILRLDPDFAPPRQLKDLVWARSSIQSAKPVLTRENRSLLSSLLHSLRALLRALTVAEQAAAPLRSRPALPPPALPDRGSFQPPRYFSKGSSVKERGAPIPYLLIETNEISAARPVPGNSIFLRSLAKGKGVLKKTEQGLYYLDIDNRFVLSLLPYLKAFGLIRPPYFNLLGKPEGAHIPVISPRESSFHYLDQIGDVGREFSFEVEGLYSLEPTLWPEVEQVWFFKVHSPELEAVRQRQHLISRPGGHPFHIAVAIQPRLTQMRPPQPLPLMRVNIAFQAA